MSLLIEPAALASSSPRQTTAPGRILIVTSCTKDKDGFGLSVSHQLTAEQLWNSDLTERIRHDWGELEKYRIPAIRLYKGRQHLQLLQGIERLRQTFGQEVVDLKIISAGFGLVDENQPIPPYNATFNDLPSYRITQLSRHLGIPNSVNALMSGNYSCAFFLLGENYLHALDLPFAQTPSFPCLFLTGPSSHKKVPRRAPYQFVRVGQDDSIAYSYNLVGLKGQLFKLFVDQLFAPLPNTPITCKILQSSSFEQRLSNFLTNPSANNFLEIVRPYRQEERLEKRLRKTTDPSQLTQRNLFNFSPVSRTTLPAKNYGRSVRYFIPDWDDLVDPDYNFEIDQGSPSKRRYYDEVYAHELYEAPNYDGLLFSKPTVEDGTIKRPLVRDLGIHKFARFEGRPILGDCGAFSYITAEEPPYQTEEILDYYQTLGFDYGVSIDHLIIPAFYSVREKRYNLTRHNAREFIELHRKGNYTFTPIGVAQGWSPQTYRDAVAELLEWGYQYVALGGLARAKTEDIYQILGAVAPVLSQDTDMHLFGVARDRDGGYEMLRMRELGVTSFDSASYLRRAWLSSTTNYFTLDGGRYAALRISPVYASSPRVRTLIKDNLASYEQLQKLERQALQAVREYDKGQLSLDATLEAVLEIDRIEEYNYEAHQQLYRRVLEDQPWKKCPCSICQALGIEVIIFRRNDRNRRRGFHNTYVFYQRLSKLLKEQEQAS